MHAAGNGGVQPLHRAAFNQNAEAAAAAVSALLAAGSDTQVTTDNGSTPLGLALTHPPSPQRLTVAALLAAAGLVGAVLADMCASATDMARQLVPSFLASHAPALTEAQWTSVWTLIPTPCPFPHLGRYLSAALACSDDQAGQLVRRLPAADSQRLRTAALCLARWGGRVEALPPDVVWRILSLIGSD